jgi:hypothetical protein
LLIVISAQALFSPPAFDGPWFLFNHKKAHGQLSVGVGSML